MTTSRDFALAELLRVFPQVLVRGRAAQHVCAECNDICDHLAQRTWAQVTREFLSSNCDVLPLLSPEAYSAYLAAWLREALLCPDEGVATMVLINLGSSPPVSGFNAEQARVIISAAREIASGSIWGPDDEATERSIAAIEETWSRVPANPAGVTPSKR